MKILFIYPSYPETFWSFKHALKLINKKAAHPPLGILTVAAMLPSEWQKKLIDMNIERLKDEDIAWADYVFISAMVVQKQSVKEVIARCKGMKKRIVAGGPLFTMETEEYGDADSLILGEAEASISEFLEDFKNGKIKKIYSGGGLPDLSRTPAPLWSLIKMKKYASMNIQYSRGCPYDCEFCNITSLFGRVPRTKNANQILNELDSLYKNGWRGGVFIVDDNFMGNKEKLKKEILPRIIDWRKKHNGPFDFSTEISINLADDEELMDLMVEAGFDMVFVGIETPNEESLRECNKFNNTGRNLLASVQKIQNHGLEVTAGFIVGFDNDPPSIFERQISFIQNSGIVTAMVGLLNAPKGTRLYQRLKSAGRILEDAISGDNTDYSINFIPKMDFKQLLEGYKNIVTCIYSPKQYYKRIASFFEEFRPPKIKRSGRFRFYYLVGLLKLMFYLGMKEEGRRAYWIFFMRTLVKHPRFFSQAMTFAAFGMHFRKVFAQNS
jgi:radical SAM superfamily enzyme YgiQ (UPF0313 family)